MPFWSKKEEPLRNIILDTDQELRRLRRNYEMLLERELQIARMNKARKRKSKSNYAKIATAYYSLYMINETQWKLQEIAVNSEFNQAMNDLDKAFRAVNKLEGRIGDVPVEKIVKDLNKMEGYAQFREENYTETYDAIDKYIQGSVAEPENLVNNEVIEHLISEEDCLEDCLEKLEGIEKDMDELNDDIYKELNKMNDTTNETPTKSTEEVKEPEPMKKPTFDGQI